MSLNGTKMQVKDGIHPYFAALEDTGGDRGVLEPGTDMSVSKEAPNVFRLYRDYNLTISVADTTIPNVPSSAQALCSVQLLYDWPGLKQTDREFKFPLTLARVTARQDPTPALAQDIPGLDDAIARNIYPAKTGILSSVVAQVGGNLPVVQDIGAIVVLTKSTTDQQSAMAMQATSMAALLPSSPADPAKDAETHLVLGRTYERMAALSWQCLLYLKDPALRHASTLQATDLGDKTQYSAEHVCGEINDAADFWPTFKYNLGYAIYHYSKARSLLSGPTTRAFRRMMLDRKIVELVEMKCLVEGSPDLTYLKGWIDYLITLYRGRVRSFTDYLARERPSAESLPALEASNPSLVTRISNANTAAQVLQQLSQRAKQVLL